MSEARKAFGVVMAAAALAVLSASAFAQSAAPEASGSGPPQTLDTPPRAGTSEDVIIAPEEKRATSPDGDPRSIAQKHDDQMAYDQCLLRAPEPDMTHPVDTTPGEYCSQRLGMSNRNAVPDSVSNQRHSY